MDRITAPTRPPTAGMMRLETCRGRRRRANIAAFILVVCAITMAAVALWMLSVTSGMLPRDIRWLLYFVVGVHVICPLWYAYAVYLPAHTVLEFSSVSLRLTRSLPLREWSAPWRAVQHAYFYKGLLAIGTTERIWHGWAVNVAPSDALLVDELKRHLGPGVWLDDRQARFRIVGRVFLEHAILIAVTLVGSRLVSALSP